MPTLYTADGRSAVFDSTEEVNAALAAGWQLPEGGTVDYTTSISGDRVSMAPDRAALRPGAADLGVAAPDAGFSQTLESGVHDAYSGLGDQLIGAAEGAGSVLSLGLTDLALDAAGADTALRAEHTVGRTVGEVAAIVGTALSPFGKGAIAKTLSKTPAGMVSKFGTGGSNALARIAHTAGEGAAYGVGQAVSNIALANPGMTAEQVVSELGQGALLGAALGAGAGAIGEGVSAGRRAYAARAKAAVVDLDNGIGKEAVQGLAKAQKDIDENLVFAAGEHSKLIKAARTAAGSERAAVMTRHVDELHAQVSAMRPAAVDGAKPKYAAEFATADAKAAKALKTGREQDALEYLEYVRLTAAKTGATDLAAAAQAKTAEYHALAKAADEQLAGMAVKFPEPPHAKVFNLRPDEKVVGPDAFKRLIRDIEKNPADALKRIKLLDDYHKAALDAAKGNEVALARVTAGMEDLARARDLLLSTEAQGKLSDPKVLLSLLGVAGGAELLPDGPAQSVLQLAAAYKLVGGIAGLKGATRGIGHQIRRMISGTGRRVAAGLGSGLVRESAAVKKLHPVLQTGAIGGGAGFLYNLYGMAERGLSGRATKAVLQSTDAVHKAVDDAVGKVTSGKPAKRARALPGINMVLDKLLGDPQASSGKTPQEKFKVVQQRLATYTVAPDAALNGVYEALRPLQEVNEYLADEAEMKVGAQLEYLAAKMPRDPGTMMLFGKSMWNPTDRELYEFSVCATGVLYPLEVIGAIADGLVPPQAAEALAATNPEIFTKFQTQIIENADAVRANSTYNQKIALGLAFQVPLEPTADARYVSFMQSMHAQKTMEQAAGQAGEAKDPEDSYSDAQKLLS